MLQWEIPACLVLGLRNQTGCFFIFPFFFFFFFCLFAFLSVLFCSCFLFESKAFGCIVFPVSNKNTRRIKESESGRQRQRTFSWMMTGLLIEEQLRSKCLSADLYLGGQQCNFDFNRDARHICLRKWYKGCSFQFPVLFLLISGSVTTSLSSLDSPYNIGLWLAPPLHQWTRLYHTLDDRYRTSPRSFISSLLKSLSCVWSIEFSFTRLFSAKTRLLISPETWKDRSNNSQDFKYDLSAFPLFTFFFFTSMFFVRKHILNNWSLCYCYWNRMSQP